MFHENTWKRAASGKPDLSLTSLSQSTFQQLLVQVFQNWGSPPGGLDAAGEQEPGGAGVQKGTGGTGAMGTWKGGRGLKWGPVVGFWGEGVAGR